MQNNDLSNAELHLWETVQKNPQKIAKMSIVKLNQFAHVSTNSGVLPFKLIKITNASSLILLEAVLIIFGSE